MDREKLISKWLNHELSDKELEAFKQLEDYAELQKLQKGVEQFGASSFDTDSELETLKTSIDQKKKQPRKLWATLAKVAAVLVVGFLAFNYFSSQPTTFQTLASEHTFIELPDQSTVNLNADSQISYNDKHWNRSRRIALQGEAFFNVAKGATFKVETTQGTVTVYGTQFNVKQRDNLFEVICYEGLVGVKIKGEETRLRRGDRIYLINDVVHFSKEFETSPTWIRGVSTFSSIPFGEVIAEFERQHNLKIEMTEIDPNKKFSGSFSHTNIDLALKAITIPMDATYEKSAEGYRISREK